MSLGKWLYKSLGFCFPQNWGGRGGEIGIPAFIWRNNKGIAMKDVKGKGRTDLFYQSSSVMINTAICCVAKEGIIDGLVRGSDPKSQRKNVPTLTRTLDLRDRVGLSLICYHNGS